MAVPFGPYLAGTIGGIAGSMIVGDTLHAVPVKPTGPSQLSDQVAPQGKSATPRVTGDANGIVTSTNGAMSGRAATHLSAIIIISMLVMVVILHRYFGNARIG